VLFLLIQKALEIRNNREISLHNGPINMAGSYTPRYPAVAGTESNEKTRVFDVMHRPRSENRNLDSHLFIFGLTRSFLESIFRKSWLTLAE
jgi:hypothetical protein